jgi:hypothetical protein
MKVRNMDEELRQCHFLYESVMDFSSPYTVLKVKMFLGKPSRIISSLTKPKAPSGNAEIINLNAKTMNLNLAPGELVQVRSLEEISATLDENNKLKGLLFMPEMRKFCGKKFRVFKRVDKIMLESTGEFRKLKTPSIFLEDVFCDGEFHQNCDRSCFCFWREAWLERTE